MTLARDECPDDRRPLVDPPGARLRRIREAHGLTLDDISRTTKISKSVLTAIEAGDVLHLPAKIYTRGFVRSYAAEIGLDPERTAEEYLHAIEPVTAHHLLVDDGQLPPLAQTTAVDIDANEDAQDVLAANQFRRFGWLTTAAAAVGLIVYIASFGARQDAQRSTPIGPSEAAASDAVPASHTQEPLDQSEAALTAAAVGPLRVELIPDGPCWLSVSVDGVQVFARLLQAGDRETLAIDKQAVMRVGDPGALTLMINGRAVRPLGPAGQPVNVTITKDNYRQFISS